MLDIAKHNIITLHAKIRSNWRKSILFGVGVILLLIIIGQCIYPSDRLALFTTIDGVSMSGWRKDDAIKKLDSDYLNKSISIYFGKAKKPYISPKPAEIGLTISNENRINSSNYPWYLRIVPTSALWVHLISDNNSKPTYKSDSKILASYISTKLGDSCSVKPENASLKVSGVKFEVIPSQNGGICDLNVVRQMLSKTEPMLNKDSRVLISVKEILPDVTDDLAGQFGDHLSKKIGTGINVIVNGTPQLIPATQIFSWIDFNADSDQLNYLFNTERATAYLNQEFAAKVAAVSGTTTVNTYNFVETSRVVGPDGKKLDIVATLNNLHSFIDGDYEQAIVATAPVAPQIAYSRSYSSNDIGLSALMLQYAQSHPGIYGVSMVELSGQNRRATYNDTHAFITASTYKLFVAYSTLLRIENGSWHWEDKTTSSKNLAVCFDDMIVKSDNDCAAAMLAKVGYTNITNEARAIGCADTSFLGKDNIMTTTADLANLLARLQTGQILAQQSSRDRLIDAMKRNVYRQGIPAGISGSIVADKVGFMDNLLHDASIVYSPTGTYVLVIMSDGSSWSTIADFASKIEALRIQ